MDAKLFKHNCLLTIESKDKELYYVVGNILIPHRIAKPKSNLFINISLFDIALISKYIRDYYCLRLTYKRIASIIIEGSI